MIYYTENDIEELKKHKDAYYVPRALFDTMQYKVVRLEVKWAYTACLNVLIHHPSYDQEGKAYLQEDNVEIIETLKNLAHKNVDKDKIRGYVNEMEKYELIERNDKDIYLKKIINVF